MSTGKRLAKRSIVGTRVCAPGDDGKYYSGYISAVNNPPQPNQELGGLNITPNTRYVVRFDPPPPGCQAPHPLTEFSDRQLIGPGFGSVNDTKLVPGQRVFLTYNGREIQAEVVHHHEDTDDVIMAPTGEGLPSTLNRKLDEVRLLESRKSARLADTDTDFARLADMGSDRKRTVTQSIDVPHSQQMMQTSRKRRTSSSYSSEPRIIEGGEQLDECSAAMVLMSLMTPPGHQVSITQDDVYDERWESGQTDLCGANSSESNSEASWRSATPSPPLSDESGNVSWPSGSNSLNQQQEYYQRQSQAHHQANAAAAASRIIAAAASAHSKYSPNSDYSSSYDGRRNNGKSSYCGGNNANHHGQSSVSSGSPRTDEGWQSDPDHHLPPRKQKRSSVVRSIFREQPIMRMQYSSCGYNMLENRENNNNFINEAMKGEDFYENDVVRDGIRWKCVWRPESLRHQVCGFRGPTWNSVAIHCVKCHLNKDGDPQKLHTKEELDFYVDEEVYDESQEDNMICSGFSPPTKSHFDMARPRAEDPEYQEQIRLLIQNSNPQPSNNTNNLMIANVVSMAPQAMKQIKPAIGKPLQAYNAPLNIVSVINKVPQSNRRVRGETKKCRKVYGMEHKDLWCTQCKWKKACTRFNDA